jgi:transketolase
MTNVAGAVAPIDTLYFRAATEFAQWEIIKDIVDECMALMLNYRQSGHPGGSFSKAHTFLATLLSGAMRFDLLRP